MRKLLVLALLPLFVFTACKEPQAEAEVITSVVSELNIGAAGGPVEVIVAANVVVTAESGAEWLVCEATKAKTSELQREVYKFTLTAEENTSTEGRSAVVTFKGEKSSLEIKVNQDGCDPLLSNAGEGTFNVPAEGQEIEVKVTANIEYEVNCDAEWISRIVSKASRTDIVKFTVAPNPGEPREAQIDFVYGDITVSVSVSQDSAPFATLVVPDDIPCVTGLGVTFDYQLTGDVSEGTEVAFVGNNGWKAEVTPGADGISGTVKVQAPAEATEADVDVVISDNLGVRSTTKLAINLIQQGARIENYAYHCFDDVTPFTHDRLVKMGEAGVHIVHCIHPEKFEAAAEAAKGADVKLVGYFEDYIYHYVNWSDEDYKAFIATDQKLIDRVNLYRSCDQLWGYALIDEPRDSLFVKIGMLTDRLHELDPEHPCYVNLWGDQMNDECLKTYIRDAHPDQVCFDHYAVTSGNADAHWYTRLESLFRVCTTQNIPWWGFAASADIGNVPEGVQPPPTPQSLRLYHYTLLAYGASELMYFTWLHYKHGGAGWTIAPLMTDGTYSVIYDYVKNESVEINNHMFIFRNAKFKGVRHVAKENSSSGVTVLKSVNDPFMPSVVDWYEFRTGAFLSYMENNGNEYLLIEGKSNARSTKFSMAFKKDIWRVTREGWFEPVKWNNGEIDNEYYFQLEPGEPLILKVK